MYVNYKKFIVIFLYMILLTACTKPSANEEKSQDKDKETITLANKMDLFNSLEDILKQISDKKYIEAYDALTEIYELSNKANIVSEKTDASANLYIQNLNIVSDNIHTQSNQQKNNEIYFSYEKSQLSIISNMSPGKEKESGGSEGGSSGGESSGKDSSGGSGSGGSEGGGSSSSSEDSKSSGSEENKQQIVIPEEEALKKYPEILVNDQDKQIYDLSVDLMGYVSKITLESDKENTNAITNREKYLLYKISSLVDLNKYQETYDYISEAQNNWDKLYTKVEDKNKEDVVTLNALLKNINTSVDKKNQVGVKLQTKIAIKILDDLTTKAQ